MAPEMRTMHRLPGRRAIWQRLSSILAVVCVTVATVDCAPSSPGASPADDDVMDQEVGNPRALVSQVVREVNSDSAGGLLELFHPDVRTYLEHQDPDLRTAIRKWDGRSARLRSDRLEIYPLAKSPFPPFSNQYLNDRSALYTRHAVPGAPESDDRFYIPVGYFPAGPTHTIVQSKPGDDPSRRYLSVPPDRNYIGLVSARGRWYATVMSNEIPEHLDPLPVQ